MNSRSDDRVFTVFAFLNLVMPPDEDRAAMHPVRAAVRDALEQVPAKTSRRLRFLYEEVIARADPFWFAATALSLSAAPEFEVNLPKKGALDDEFVDSLSKFIGETVGFAGHLTEFYRAARVRELWRRAKPEYERTGARMRAQAGKALPEYERVIGMSIAKIAGGEITILPNLLERVDRSYVVPSPGGVADIHGPRKGDRYLPIELIRPVVKKALSPAALDPVVARLSQNSDNPRATVEDALLRAVVAVADGARDREGDGAELVNAFAAALASTAANDPLAGRIGQLMSAAARIMAQGTTAEPQRRPPQRQPERSTEPRTELAARAAERHRRRARHRGARPGPGTNRSR